MGTLLSAWGLTEADAAGLVKEHRFSNGTRAWWGGLDYRNQRDFACHMRTGWYWSVMQGARRGAYAAVTGFAARSDDATVDMYVAFKKYIAVDRTDPDPDFLR